MKSVDSLNQARANVAVTRAIEERLRGVLQWGYESGRGGGQSGLYRL
jgi:hypothetical protein